MAYTRINFKDQNVERPRTYTMSENADNTVTLTNSFGTVTEAGTPINATNMNHIEDGIVECENSIDLKIVEFLKTLYPVGSLYITANNTCPMASIITGSTWQLVATGRALWCGNGSNGNSTIEAGLPKITGQFANGQPSWAEDSHLDGAFYYHKDALRTANDGSRNTKVLRFNASRESSIYGNSTTVQPPAYVVNVYRRTA